MRAAELMKTAVRRDAWKGLTVDWTVMPVAILRPWRTVVIFPLARRYQLQSSGWYCPSFVVYTPCSCTSESRRRTSQVCSTHPIPTVADGCTATCSRTTPRRAIHRSVYAGDLRSSNLGEPWAPWSSPALRLRNKLIRREWVQCCSSWTLTTRPAGTMDSLPAR